MTEGRLRLSKHFFVDEIYRTSVKDLEQTNRSQVGDNFNNGIDLAREVLDFIADKTLDKFGAKPVITSWFRGPALNTRVGGSPKSQHCEAAAADFVLPIPEWGWQTAGDVMELIAKLPHPYGQAIREINSHGSVWIHLSLPRGNMRYQLMDQKNGKYYVFEKTRTA